MNNVTVSFNATMGQMNKKAQQQKTFNTSTFGLIQAVRKKQLDRTWLCAGISPLLYGLRTWLMCQKTQ